MRILLLIAAGAALSACSTADVSRAIKGEPPPPGGSLAGASWLVEDVNGGGVIDNAQLALTFEAGSEGANRLSGASGCNRFSGSWQQTGETIKVGPLATTMMACAPALMDLEQKFLATLAAVTTVSFDATGAATLKAPDGQVITIRREPIAPR